MHPIAQRAVRVYVFLADQALISASDRVEAPAASFDRSAHQQHADCHAEHHEKKYEEGCQERGHITIPSCREFIKGSAADRGKSGIGVTAPPINKQHRDSMRVSDLESAIPAQNEHRGRPSVGQHRVAGKNRR